MALLDTEPVGQKYPRGHGAGVTLPLGQAEPYGHTCAAEMAVALVGQYLPAGQREHVAPSALLAVPAKHVTLVGLVDPDGHACPTAHGPEHCSEVDAEALPYLPAGHGC